MAQKSDEVRKGSIEVHAVLKHAMATSIIEAGIGREITTH